MATSIEKIKDRVRKLFNLASDDAAADGEISNALKAARELMLAHQLSEDDIAEQTDLRTPDEIAADAEYGEAKSWSEFSRVPRWQGVLASAVRDFIGTVSCVCARAEVRRSAFGFAQNDGAEVGGFVFFGPHDDALLASELHAELVLTCATVAKLRFGGGLVSGPARDYCDGFASGLYHKIQDAKKAVENSAVPKLDGKRCTALTLIRAENIIAAKRRQAVKWYEQEHGIKLRKGGSYNVREVRDERAFRQGKADGARQTLSKSRTARIGYRA